MGVIPPGASGPTNPLRRFALGAGGPDRSRLEDRTQTKVTEALQDDADTEFVNPFGDFNGIMGGLVKALQGVYAGAIGWLNSLSSMFAGKWDQLETVTDGQLELNDRVDLLSPLQDYGSCYASGSGNLINTGRVPFNKQIGPMIGCHLDSNGIVLEEEGLWDIRARLAFSWTIGGGAQTWRIRVYRPDGSLFSEQLDYSSESNENTREMNTSVVVPAPNYRVEVWITALIALRATIGGPQHNRFTVQHITRDTSFPI